MWGTEALHSDLQPLLSGVESISGGRQSGLRASKKEFCTFTADAEEEGLGM
jgi:hypothetical protein